MGFPIGQIGRRQEVGLSVHHLIAVNHCAVVHKLVVYHSEAWPAPEFCLPVTFGKPTHLDLSPNPKVFGHDPLLLGPCSNNR